jgi:hypothetical protein
VGNSTDGRGPRLAVLADVLDDQAHQAAVLVYRTTEGRGPYGADRLPELLE